MIEEKTEKMIYLVSNFADQMSDDYLTEKKVSSPPDQEEEIKNLNEEELFESLIRKYTKDNRGITLGQDFSSLEELGFFLSEETRVKEGYEGRV